MEESKSLEPGQPKPDQILENSVSAVDLVELSDETEVRGKKWDKLKEHALTSTFH